MFVEDPGNDPQALLKGLGGSVLRHADAETGPGAGLFQKFAAEQPDSPDAPNALFNAALAWDKAKEPKRAIAEGKRLSTICWL